MITTITTLTDSDLNNVTGGNLSLAPRGGSGGGGFSLGGALQGAKNLGSNAWEGLKNQASKTKEAWSGFAKMPFEGFSRMITPH